MESKKRMRTDEESTISGSLKKKFESFVNRFEQEFKDIISESELHLDHFSEWEQTHDAILKKIEKSVSNTQKIVRLEIGGKLFVASKETLTTIENTYFYGLLANKDKYKPQENGTFLIERNPLVFDRILDYLRTGKMDTRDLTDYMLDMLKDDLDYYCIPFPEGIQSLSSAILAWDMNKKPDNCRIFNNNITVVKISEDEGWDCGVTGNVPVDRFTVKVEDRGSDGCLMIGFTTGESWNSNGDNRDNGWFISVYSGNMFGIGITAGNGTSYTSEINNGDYITVIRERNTIRFEKNKIDLGICPGFADVPNHPLFPSLDICDRGVIVTLVNNY